mmetsp:Transcript_31136/g.89265  ORF Transcript_31136/g.89265 Transcript_31136/m.89265 type:complete len:211 (-) Transcript_31136:55-687(-)
MASSKVLRISVAQISSSKAASTYGRHLVLLPSLADPAHAAGQNSAGSSRVTGPGAAARNLPACRLPLSTPSSELKKPNHAPRSPEPRQAEQPLPDDIITSKAVTVFPPRLRSLSSVLPPCLRWKAARVGMIASQSKCFSTNSSTLTVPASRSMAVSSGQIVWIKVWASATLSTRSYSAGSFTCLRNVLQRRTQPFTSTSRASTSPTPSGR